MHQQQCLVSACVLAMSIWFASSGLASANDEPRDAAVSVGLGTSTLQSSGAYGGCGTITFNSDGSYENAYAWQYGGVADPYFGAFAECYTVPSYTSVCSAMLDLTQLGGQSGQSLDAFVWEDDGGQPGILICTTSRVTPEPFAFWPKVSRYEVEFQGCCVEGAIWIGFRGVWPGDAAGWYVGADLDGPGGCPLTNVAPGIGYPTGWVNTSLIWGPTQALGIGAQLTTCFSSPVSPSSWGRVKKLFSR